MEEAATKLPFGLVPRGQALRLIGGGSVFVRMTGERRSEPAVLLLHGLGATAALNWASCFEPLARRTQVIALDHRGHGRGARVGNRFRLTDCADDAAELLRTLDAAPAIVIGYSMGGPIAQLVAQRHPDVVAGLVLSATARDFRGRPGDRLRFAAAASLAAAARFGPPVLAPPVVPVLPGRWRPVGWALAELRRSQPSAVMAAAADLGRFTSRDWIGDLDVPSTVIVHSEDRTVPPSRQRRLAAALPGAEVLEVGLDHLGPGRRPATYVSALLQAYGSVARRARERQRVEVA